MQKEINDDPGGVNVTVRIINDTFFLFGKVDSTTDRDRALTIAETYLPELMGSVALRENAIMTAVKKVAIRNMIQVEEPPAPPAPRMVRITYHFVEIGKDYLKQNMFKWVPLIQEQQNSGLQIGEKTNGGVGAQSSNGSFSATITNLLPKLSAASNGGFSRVLFSTVQLTEDKVKTKLSRQEQIPFVGAVVNGVPVTSTANMGIVVEVEPEILGDKVRLACNFSFSTPVGNGAGGQPRVISSASENRIIVKSGESAAIAGLIDNRAAKNVNKDPENTPPGNPIFTLLRSKAFSASKSQFVVFITPKIIDDASEGTADIKAKILNNGMKKRRRTVQ
jgi:pilus assembly protein CpaC